MIVVSLVNILYLLVSKKIFFFFLIEISLFLGPAFLLLALFMDRCSPVWDKVAAGQFSFLC